MRAEGWEALLTAHVERAAGVAFAWGRNDCALWAADWVYACTGNDFASAWRGLYSTEGELNELLAERGLTRPEDIADAVGLPDIPVPLAQRGDVVLWNGCLGVCTGLASHFLTGRGVTPVRTAACARAWAVR